MNRQVTSRRTPNRNGKRGHIAIDVTPCLSLVPKGGFEPPRAEAHCALNSDVVFTFFSTDFPHEEKNLENVSLRVICHQHSLGYGRGILIHTCSQPLTAPAVRTNYVSAVFSVLQRS